MLIAALLAGLVLLSGAPQHLTCGNLYMQTLGPSVSSPATAVAWYTPEDKLFLVVLIRPASAALYRDFNLDGVVDGPSEEIPAGSGDVCDEYRRVRQ